MNTDPQRLLSAILKTEPDAIITIDALHRIVIFNAGAEVIFGYRADEIVGQSIDILLPEDMRQRHRGYIEAFVAGNEVSRMMRQRKELVGRRKNGTTFEAEASIAKIDENGETTATVILRDIGHRKEMEKKLRQAHKIEAMGQLSGGIAHEFNNMLLVILGNIEMMQEGLEPDHSLQRFVAPMLTSATRGAELAQNLLTFSRRQKLDFGRVDLNEIVQRTEELLERTLGNEIEIVTLVANDLWLTSADSGQIEAALVNLVLNARDAMPDGGTVTIRTANITVTRAKTSKDLDVPMGDYVVLAVADTGSGMTADVIEQAFDPFFTTKGVGKGTGLGLSVVHGFVKQSGGFVHIDSTVGKGTTVRLGFPREDGSASSETDVATDSEEPARGSGMILVVEGSLDVRTLVTNLLTDLGYDVLEAGDGLAALELLEKHPEIDLLFSDVALPHEMDGTMLSQQARDLYPDLKVLLTSGYPHRRTDGQTVGGEAIPILPKPYQKFELAEFIAAIFGGADNA